MIEAKDASFTMAASDDARIEPKGAQSTSK